MLGIQQSIKPITSIKPSINIDQLQENILKRLEEHDLDVKKLHGDLTSLIKQEIIERLNQLHRLGSQAKSIKSVLEKLTLREKQMVGILLEQGFLTYKEIATVMNVSSITVKSTINRMMKDLEKKKLITKELGKPARVGVSEEFESMTKKKPIESM
jgi:DNA-directed RNA polymerase specialized sigma24 family protein